MFKKDLLVVVFIFVSWRVTFELTTIFLHNFVTRDDDCHIIVSINYRYIYHENIYVSGN